MSGGGLGDDEEFVAGLQLELGAGDGGFAVADDGGDDGAAGEGDVGEGVAYGAE